jgi:mannose-6-phosphate isomerase-like protein (cupin superfamily)
MGYRSASLDELGDGYGFRKVRQALGVTAFGANFIVYPPGAQGIHHYHDEQDELYFVHRGTARFEVGDDVFELGAGGLVHVESTTLRRVSNAGEDDLVLLIVGGKGGYVGRDGQAADAAELEKRRAMSRGEFR